MSNRNLDIAFSKAFDDFDIQLKRMEKVTGEKSKKILWKYSGIFAAKLVRYTQPSKPSKKAQELGKGAVEGDIYKIYTPAKNLYLEILKESALLARAFWKAYKDGDKDKIMGMIRNHGGTYRDLDIISSFDGGRAHMNARNNRGRVNARGNRKLILTQDSKVRSYIDKISKRVGYTKAGWISGFSPPGGVRGVPRWVKGQKGSHGRVYEETKKNGDLKNVIFHNKVPYVKSKLWWKAVDVSLRATVRTMKKDIEKSVIEAAKEV